VKLFLLAALVFADPVSPLTKNELSAIVSALQADARFPKDSLFPQLSLLDPEKSGTSPRSAFAVVLDRSQAKTYEAVIRFEAPAWTVVSWTEVPHHAMFLIEELTSAPEIIRADEGWRAAMNKRGITNYDDVQIDAWAPALPDKARLVRGLSFYKAGSNNFYGRPIEGVVALVDMAQKKVIKLVDTGVVPLSEDKASFDEKTVAKGPKPKPLKITQPQGPDYRLELPAQRVSWRGWNFRFSMHPRDGLVLHEVSFKDKKVLHRASLSEMVVPYGDPDPVWSWRSAFDVGEYGLGRLASPLEPNVDAPDNAKLIDADFADDFGKAYTLPRAIALYEKDGGLLWKHYTLIPESNESRRARDLVVGMIATVGNYDYGLNWVFHEDGTLEALNELTGIMLAKGVKEGGGHHSDSPYWHRVSPRVAAPHHQHFFNYRLDFDVDGPKNTVAELNTAPVSSPEGNAFTMHVKPLTSEKAARRSLDLSANRKWIVVDEKQVGGYVLVPGENSIPYGKAHSLMRKRAGFINHHVWATAYKPGELNAAGAYPNQSKGGDGLPQWSGNESLLGTDVVLWYTFGVTHVPRPEEWPIMPVHRTGFKLLPAGMFPRNPTLERPR
jgi:primary-amine oxidase